MPKRLRIFAGPNGSGKSAIEALVSSKYNIGNLINADQNLFAVESDRIFGSCIYCVRD